MSTKETEVQSQNKESSEEVTQQTTEQQNRPTESFDPNYVRSLEERIAEQQIQNRRLERLVEGVRSTREERPQPKTRNIEEERKKFYEDPVGSLDSQLQERDNKILKQMSEMLEPIRRVASSFGADNEYRRLKTQLKSDRIFGNALRDPEVESAVDAIVVGAGIEITEDAIKSAIAQVVGVRAMNGLGNGGNRNNNTRVDPPVVPPSRVRVEGEVTRKELTENDRMAMRIAGLKPGNPTDEQQYWDLISNETMTLDIHKKK